MRTKFHVISMGLFLSLVSAGASLAGDADLDQKARQGTVRCGGSHFLRLGGTEIHFTTYNLRNLSSTTPITIERVVFLDAAGGVLFDSGVSGFPATDNGILGPSDQVLDPNQTAQLDTLGLLPFLAETQRPIQLEISWSAPLRVLTLDVSLVRVVRERDPATGLHGAERSRHLRDCRTIGR